MLRSIVFAFGVVVALALPAAVSAQTADYPGGPPPQVQGVVVERGRPDGASNEPRTQVAGRQSRRGDALPVTGADLVQLAGLAVVLTAGGTALVRVRRRHEARRS